MHTITWNKKNYNTSFNGGYFIINRFLKKNKLQWWMHAITFTDGDYVKKKKKKLTSFNGGGCGPQKEK